MDKILVVEDDKTVYSGIKKLLELQHYSVVIAQNGMEALEKIDESFSLVIMDIMMPQLDGIETCRRMRERYSVPILFLSAKSFKNACLELQVPLFSAKTNVKSCLFEFLP